MHDLSPGPTSISGLRAALLARDPGAEYLHDARDGRRITGADLARAVDAWSAALDARGVPAGARVLVTVDDPLAFAVVHLAVMASGRISAPVDPAAPEADAERARRVLRPAHVIDGASPTGLPLEPVPSPAAPSDAGPGGAVLLTSGSTGTPKVVELPEAQLLHVGRAVARHHALGPGDRGFTPLPLFHVNAQVVGLLGVLVSGGSLVLDRRFRRTGFPELLAAHAVTWLNAAPAILAVLARTGFGPPPPRLRFVRSASAPLPASLRRATEAAWGVPVVESYGMTEAASQITATPVTGGGHGTVGRVVDGELQVVDRDGRPVPPGTLGRVRIRGAGVVRAYAGGDPFPDGWLDTADLGRLDADGILTLTGRADDVVNRGGELVHPREIEEVLLEEPGVLEAVVVGRPDEVLGAVPVALVRTESGADLRELLEQRCVDRLARFKRPAEIVLVDAFPTGPTGKVRRAAVREQLREQVAG